MKYLIFAALAYLAYCLVSSEKKPGADDILEDANELTNKSLLTQPQQKYPLEVIEDPRVDNANQPWYLGDRDFMGDALLTLPTGDRDSVSTYNSGAFWNELNSVYVH